ncbi:MAG: hypothetical protein WBD36_12170 [Bacteroidota bacterium]
MYERCLHEAERFLASHKDIIVPVQEVWEQVLKKSLQHKFETASLPDFTALLEGDGRFELLTSEKPLVDGQGTLFEDEEGAGAMGEMGFFSQDRVKLRRIKLPPVEEEEVETASIVRGIGATIKRHVLHVSRAGTNGKSKSQKKRPSTRRPGKTRRTSRVAKPGHRKGKLGKKR